MAIDINSASQEELAGVPEIGPDLAVDIVAYREESGPFQSLQDLANIPGCDEETVARLQRAGVEVGSFAQEGGDGPVEM